MPFPAPFTNQNLYNFRRVIGDHSRAYLFMVSVPPVAGNDAELTAFARTTKLPEYVIDKTEIPFQGMKYKVATVPIFADWSAEFLADDAMELRMRFLQWQASIYDAQRQLSGSPAFYKADNMTVRQLNRIGKVVLEYGFIGAFPINVSEIALDHGNTEIEKFTVTFAYDYYNVNNTGIPGASIAAAPSPDVSFVTYQPSGLIAAGLNPIQQ